MTLLYLWECDSNFPVRVTWECCPGKVAKACSTHAIMYLQHQMKSIKCTTLLFKCLCNVLEHWRRWPFPVVWSPAGPVLGVSVGPDLLSQSNLSSAPCTHAHRPSSKEQREADRAEDGKRSSELAKSSPKCSPVGFYKAWSMKHATTIVNFQYMHVHENLFTWRLVGFFTVQKRDIIHSKNMISSRSVPQSRFIHATEPNLRTDMITFMVLKK